MKTDRMINALNLTEGEVLTLEKMADRMEFEALAGLAGAIPCIDDVEPICAIYSADGALWNCSDYIGCLCDCPMVSYTID